MPKTKISEYSSTANSNTDVASINVDEGCAPSGINNAIRAVMGHLKDFQTGAASDPLTVGGALTTSSTVTHNGGTANGVGYLNGSKVLTTGSALTFDGTTFRNTAGGSAFSGVVGAGISASVNGRLRAFNSTNDRFVEIYNDATTSIINSTYGSAGASPLVFQITDSEKMRLDSSGNLGLGVTPSAWSASFKAIQVGSTGVLYGISNFTGVGNNFFNDGAAKYQTTNAASFYAQGSGAHAWHTAPSGTAGNAITFTQAMTLDASGRLGVGVTSPAYKIDAYDTGGSFMQLYQNDGTYNRRLLVTANATGANAGITLNATSSVGSDNLIFQAASTERARIDSSGRLLVGTTSSIGTASVGRLQVLGGETFITTNSEVGGFVGVNSNIDNSVAIVADPDSLRSGSHIAFYVDGFSEKARIDSSGNLLVGTTSANNAPANGVQLWGSTAQTSSGGLIAVGHVSGASSGSQYQTFSYNGSIIGSVTQSGTTAVLYNTTSDQRLKENIVDAAPASALIDSLQVRQYDWKSDGSHQRYGFVAQELVTVAPEAVHQPADSEEMMAVDYSKLVPMLVKEIQSLRKRLAAAGI